MARLQKMAGHHWREDAPGGNGPHGSRSREEAGAGPRRGASGARAGGLKAAGGERETRLI